MGINFTRNKFFQNVKGNFFLYFVGLTICLSGVGNSVFAQMFSGDIYGKTVVGANPTLVTGTINLRPTAELYLGAGTPSGSHINTLILNGNYIAEENSRIYLSVTDNTNTSGTRGFVDITGTANRTTGATTIELDLFGGWDGSNIDLIRATNAGSDTAAFRMNETMSDCYIAAFRHRIEGNNIVWYIEALPPVGDIGASPAVCSGSDLTLTVPNIALNNSAIISQGWEIETAVGSGIFIVFNAPFTVTIADTGKRIRYIVESSCGTVSSNTVVITVHPVYHQETLTIYSTDLPYTWHDTVFDVGTTSNVFVFERKSVHGCDSIVTLHLTVNPVCLEIVLGEGFACANDTHIEISYTIIGQGILRGYTVSFDALAQQAGFTTEEHTVVQNEGILTISIPSAVRPGHYFANFSFPGQVCGDATVTVPFTINYSPLIIAQRWNNLLFVQNNSGFEFSTFQWYKNGEPIWGATSSYLHISEGLDMDAEYSVELIRVGDDFSVFTCPAAVRWVENVTLTLVNVAPRSGSFQLNSSLPGTAQIYNLTGILVSEQVVRAGQNHLQAPDQAGYYLLRVTLENQETKTYHIYVMQ